MIGRLCFLSVVLASCAGATAGDDPVRERLDEAKASYDKAMEEHRRVAGRWFEKEDEAARRLRSGVTERVRQVAAEKSAFETGGVLPARAPAPLKERGAQATDAMLKAYRAASDEYSRQKRDDRAAEVERELAEFRGKVGPPADAVPFAGKRYKAFTDRLSWHEAKARCEAMGGRLAVVTSGPENQLAARLVKGANLDEAWLGASDEKAEGEWAWVDGSRMRFADWGPQQPNNKDPGEHFLVLVLSQGGRWSDQPDRPVQHRPGFVCQWD